jgi:hypothetical protein
MGLLDLLLSKPWRTAAHSDRPVVPPGRNQPCWCGSGHKYKHCHLAADQELDTRRRVLERSCNQFT